MSLILNLRHLESKNLELKGSLDTGVLNLDAADELIHLPDPLIYELEVIKSTSNLLVQGHIRVALACECSRCLKPFPFDIILDPWVCHLPLEGEECVVITNDCVDLTPYVREDIVLAFPQQPLCNENCEGLIETVRKPGVQSEPPQGSDPKSSPWSTLDNLNL
jgi:uncharacterized protein